MELEKVQSTPTEQVQLTLAPNPIQLHIVVGDEFASMVGDEVHDDVADTFFQDMGAVGTDEVRVLVELSSHDYLIPSAGSKSISSSHTTNSMGQLAVPHFQRD